MNIKIVLLRIYQAIFKPAERRAPVGLFRSFIRLPIVFDLVSLILQLLDFKNLKKLNELTLTNNDQFERAINHNVSVVLTKFITITRRVELLYQLLSFHSPKKIYDMKIIIIGPRNIQELLVAWTYGFSWKNIIGIDLFSTNKKIHTMNMEDIKYEDNSFDCVTMSNTLVYADNIKKALSELARILKPNGLAVFGATYDPNNVEKYPESARNGKYIHEILKETEMEIFFHIARDKKNSAGNKQTTHIFGCKKKDLNNESFDPLYL